jgi:hypothetical protein
MALLYSTVPIGSRYHSTFNQGLAFGLVISVDSILEELPEKHPVDGIRHGLIPEIVGMKMIARSEVRQ